MRSLAAVAAVLLLAGCAPGPPGIGADPGAEPGDSDLSGSLTVAAAASLEAAFTELVRTFAAEHTGVDVRPLILDGSATLATQLAEGAPFDVLATANEASLRGVDAHLDDATVFATNTLQLVVASGNPLDIDGLDDLAGLDVVLCAPAVPCGDASHRLLDAAGVTITPVSEEQSVSAVLAKVRSGEADAGLVYRTDVAAASGSVTGVDITGADAVVNRYPIAVVADSSNRAAARAFVAFVMSGQGQRVLADHGFGAP